MQPPLKLQLQYNCNYHYHCTATTTWSTAATTSSQLQDNYSYSYITTTTSTTLQLQLPPQRQLHYTTPGHTTFSSCGWADHCNHSKKHNSNHLSVHQWIRSAIHASQQLTSSIVVYLWNFRQPPCAVLLVTIRAFSIIQPYNSHDDNT